MMGFGQIWTFARNIEDLLALQRKTEAALELINGRLHQLENRMTHLEADQPRIITEAKSAAATAANVFASGALMELTTRLTKLEVQSTHSLPPNAFGQSPKALTPD